MMYGSKTIWILEKKVGDNKWEPFIHADLEATALRFYQSCSQKKNYRIVESKAYAIGSGRDWYVLAPIAKPNGKDKLDQERLVRRRTAIAKAKKGGLTDLECQTLGIKRSELDER